jgi:hypothetical protein
MKAIVAALLTVGVLACSKGDGGGGSATQGSATQGPATQAPALRSPFVSLYRIGRSQAPDGSTTGETDMFAAGETVYMSFTVKNAPSDAKVRLVFSTLPDNRKVAELESTSTNGFVSFGMKDTKSWAPGTYRAEYFLLEDGKPNSLGIHDFKIAAAPAPGR